MHAEQLEEAQRQGGFARGRRGSGGVRFEFGGQGGPFGGLGDVFGGGGGTFGGGSDDGVFERLFRGGGPAGPRPRKGEELRQQVTVSLAEAFSGGTRTVRLPTIQPCTACAGGGRVGAAICHECLGQGRTRGDKRIEVTIPAGIARPAPRSGCAARAVPAAPAAPRATSCWRSRSRRTRVSSAGGRRCTPRRPSV